MASYTRTTYADGVAPPISAANLNNNEAALAALYGAWTATTPTITSSSGTITTSSATLNYVVQGKVCHFNVSITITNNGTGSGSLLLTSLPFMAVNLSAFAGRNSTSGKMLQGSVSAGGTTMGIRNYDGTYPVTTGDTAFVSGSYQVA